MKVKELIGLLSELTDKEVDVVFDDYEYGEVSIFSVYQKDRGEDMVISNCKPPKNTIVHFWDYGNAPEEHK